MYLKSLTVLGFKSFADKTTLHFLPGVSCIVGPNGCGKSNVSDAIRWVLGEQSAKALRGAEMADVIFNGTDSRKPMGMAEVSLTIGEVDREHLQAAGVEVEYNEVTVTRRVFRDGGSEYFINKTACRLRDIQQLFMGTGVGRASYSIMAQGHITQIISSKPDDRRMVFEEAAGITRFKAQRKESLRKLEHTEQNLLRVQDLIREVKRQIGSLQRQAGKARRYKQIAQELQLLDTQLARHRFDVLQEEVADRKSVLEKVRVEGEVCGESVLRGEDEILQLRAALSEVEEAIIAVQRQGAEVRSQMERHEGRIHYNTERVRELDEHNVQALAEITQAEERKRAAAEEGEAVAERLRVSQEAVERNRQMLETKRAGLQEIERNLVQRQEALRRAQSEAFSASQQLARARNEINSVDLQKQGNLVRLEKLEAERVQLQEERTRLEQRLEQFAADVETEKAAIQTSRGTVEQRQARSRELQQELAQAAQQLDGWLRQQAEKRSRLNVLEQLQSAYEGFSASAVAVLKQAEGIQGSLTDKIRVPDDAIAAIEAALGSQIQLILATEPAVAERILGELAANKQGRASIAALNMLAGQTAPADPVVPEGAAWGQPALSLVQADDAVLPLLRVLLGSTRVVSDLAEATRVWRESGGVFDLVTWKGDLLQRAGVYSGGHGQGGGKSASSVLGRKNQIAELMAAVQQLQEHINEASRRKGAIQSEQTQLQASLQEAQTALRSQEVAIATRQGEFNALQQSLRSLKQKLEVTSFEADRLAAQEAEGLRKRDALVTQARALEEKELTSQQLVTELGAGLEALRQERDAAQAALTEAKVASATEEQLLASHRQQHAAALQRAREMGHLLDQLRRQTEGFVARREQFLAETEDSQRQLAALQLERDQVNDRMAELSERKSSQDGTIAGREEDLRGQRRRLSELQQQRAQVELELAQKDMALQNLRQRILEKYQVHLDDVRSECITITDASEGGQPKVETLSPEAMAEAGAATDWDKVAEQVQVLQKRVEEIGPVNLVAIEEYEETEQRYQFLTTQHDDLVQAKAQLLEVIQRINTQTTEMFAETFQRIRDNFRAMFVEIFGGGKADLILVNEGDVLESGIDIVARPPGKQLQNITLLSGGEQTMTAVALLFSIYQVKPSPFCVLDELDAPLDESNINRFVRVLQRFLEHSQFIIITHNKRTIGMAGVLYGVTMEEHGVSKIVSVKFHQKDEAGQGKPLVPAPAASAEVIEGTEANAAPVAEMVPA